MSLTNKVDQFTVDADLARQIIQGDDTTVVMTDGGPVRSLAKVQKDLSDTIDQISTNVAADAARAEAARDSTLVDSTLYQDEATGRASVADGETFQVQGAGDIAAYAYRRVSAASSTLIATYPSEAAVSRQALFAWLGA